MSRVFTSIIVLVSIYDRHIMTDKIKNIIIISLLNSCLLIFNLLPWSTLCQLSDTILDLKPLLKQNPENLI